MKTLILTGGSSGIGKAAAELFADNGYRVYELSRHGKSVGGIVHIDCDVTNEQQVREAVAKVIENDHRIDVLLSNAGFGISGAVEFTDTDDARRQFDVNLFGALNVVKAVLPQMRQQHDGMILFTSSVAAVLSIPYQSFYSASKSAINALALALRNEVAQFGIRVSALMPGDVSTGFTAARDKSDAGAQVYKSMRKAVETMENDERGGMSADRLARKMLWIVTRRNPAPLYTEGFNYQVFWLLEKILPKRLSNWIVGKLYC